MSRNKDIFQLLTEFSKSDSDILVLSSSDVDQTKIEYLKYLGFVEIDNKLAIDKERAKKVFAIK